MNRVADIKGLVCGWHINCACSLPLLPSPLPSAGAGPSVAFTEKHCGLRGGSLKLEGLKLRIKFKFLPRLQRPAAPRTPHHRITAPALACRSSPRP